MTSLTTPPTSSANTAFTDPLSPPSQKGGPPKSGPSTLVCNVASQGGHASTDPEHKHKDRAADCAERRIKLDKDMVWRFVTEDQFTESCLRGPSLPDEFEKGIKHVFDHVGQRDENDMYLGLTKGIRDIFSVMKCKAFTAVHTGSRHELNANVKANDLSLLRPDISIIPIPTEVTTSEASPDADCGEPDTNQTCGRKGETEIEPPPNTPAASRSSGGSSSTLLGTDGGAVGDSERTSTSTEKVTPTTSTEKEASTETPVTARMVWAEAEVVIEVKHARSDASPFGSGKSDAKLKDLLPDGEAHKESRGQIIEYASEILRRQHRLFTYVVSIHGDNARLLYLDRSGAIVSDPFNYRLRPIAMANFLWRLFGPNATPIDRGCDPTAQRATAEHVETFKRLHTDTRFSEVERNALEHAVTEGWPIYELTIVSPWACGRAVRVSDQVATRVCLVGRPVFSSTSMVSRGTKVFVGYDLHAKVPVVIKDAWRHDRGPGCRTELTTYHDLWRDRSPSLDTLLVPFLTPLGGGDVIESVVTPAGPSTAVQSTLTLPPSRQGAPASESKLKRLRRIHVRLVLKEVCLPLNKFVSLHVLVRVIYDAVYAQKLAHERGILHRDISAGNIFICPDKNGKYRGILGDFDIAKSKDELEQGGTMPWRSGTWQFVSAILSFSPDKPHAPSDDLESTMHVLSWIVLKYLDNPWSHAQADLSTQLGLFDSLFSYRDAEGNKRHGCSINKYYAVEEGRPIARLQQLDHPLNRLLIELAELCAQHYRTMKRPTAVSGDPDTPELEEDEDDLPIYADDDIFTAPADTTPAPPVALAASSSQTPSDEPSTVLTSPLEDYAPFMSKFVACLKSPRWPQVKRQLVPGSTTSSSMQCSLPPASRQAGDKRPAEHSSQPAPTKRAKKSKASSRRSAHSASAAAHDASV